MDKKSRGWLIALLVAVMASVSLNGYGHSLSSINTSSTHDSILPQKVIVPLNVVNQLFPEINQEASTGINLTAVGNPRATRSTIYTSSDGSKKVTLTADQYESLSDASSAYQQAVQKSKLPEFIPLAIPNLGQQSFAGTVTKNAETHIGLGLLDGRLIVAVTLAGYEASPSNIANLVTLARIENSRANESLNREE